jgi:hypothetical protein
MFVCTRVKKKSFQKKFRGGGMRSTPPLNLCKSLGEERRRGKREERKREGGMRGGGRGEGGGGERQSFTQPFTVIVYSYYVVEKTFPSLSPIFSLPPSPSLPYPSSSCLLPLPLFPPSPSSLNAGQSASRGRRCKGFAQS